MKNITLQLILSILVLSTTTDSLTGQQTEDFSYEVNRVLPYLPVSMDELTEAKSVTDINRFYQSSWIKEFKSVEIITYNDGKAKSSFSKSDVFTPEQKSNMITADASSEIKVIMKYIPDNTLTVNDIKEYDFSFTTDPDYIAEYSSGSEDLLEYLRQEAVDKIPEGTLEDFALAAVKFTVDEEGNIINAHLFESSKNETVDEILVNTVCNMSEWKPSSYKDGTRVKQEFAFTVGNMKSCVVNLLNIKEYK